VLQFWLATSPPAAVQSAAGSATASLAATATATATRHAAGVATAALSASASATGIEDAGGTATAAMVATATPTATRFAAGTAAASLAATATPTGVGSVAGTAAASLVASAAGSRARLASGSATATLTATAAATASGDYTQYAAAAATLAMAATATASGGSRVDDILQFLDRHLAAHAATADGFPGGHHFRRTEYRPTRPYLLVDVLSEVPSFSTEGDLHGESVAVQFTIVADTVAQARTLRRTLTRDADAGLDRIAQAALGDNGDRVVAAIRTGGSATIDPEPSPTGGEAVLATVDYTFITSRND
jgi:hypothetical protein